MAQDAPQPATTVSGKKLLIMRGDGANPEQFGEPVGLTTKGLKFSAATTKTSVPDAANPNDNPMWVQNEVKELSAQVTGDGICAVESFALWQADMFAGVARNYRVKLDNDQLGYFYAPYILTTWELTGTFGDKVKLKVTLDNDGPVQYAANL